MKKTAILATLLLLVTAGKAYAPPPGGAGVGIPVWKQGPTLIEPVNPALGVSVGGAVIDSTGDATLNSLAVSSMCLTAGLVVSYNTTTDAFYCSSAGAGDMTKTVYDSNSDDVIDTTAGGFAITCVNDDSLIYSTAGSAWICSTVTGGGGVSDHGALTGLADDDHAQYLTTAEGAAAYQPLEATLTDIADGTIAENLVNTANPWAVNEVHSDLLTATEGDAAYQPLDATLTDLADATLADESLTLDKTLILAEDHNDYNLRIYGGQTSGGSDTPSVQFTYQGTNTYKHWLRTRHNSASGPDNAFDFYTSDGTGNGVFPTNAVHGITIENGTLGVANVNPTAVLDVTGDGAFSSTVEFGSTTQISSAGVLTLATDLADSEISDTITVGNSGSVSLTALNQAGASANQVIKWSGSQWEPGNDATGGGGSGYIFQTIDADTGTDATADTTGDTLIVTGGTGISTVGSNPDTITIDLDDTLEDISDGTIAENLVNTGNPWADNEVANNLTVDDAGIAATIMRDSEWTAATLSATGKVELATTTETITGTDATRAVTPDGLTDALASYAQPLDAQLTDLADGTLTGNFVNTANPWADNEVADDITASNYLPLAGGTLTGEATVDDLGVEFTAGDSLTDCSTFSATGGGLYYDDSEGKFKKCQDNVLTDMDTGGGAGDSIEIDSVAVVDPDFQSGGDIDFVDTSNVVTANLNAAVIIEADLNADEAPVDNDILTFDTTGANFSWQTPAELSLQPLEATLTDIADGTIAENLVNTANPWADNEVSDTITVGSGGSVDAGALPATAVTEGEVQLTIDATQGTNVVLTWSDFNSGTLNLTEGTGIDVIGVAATNTVSIAGETASTTNAGVIEIATGAETNTGTDATRAVSPDALEDWEGSAFVTTLGTIATGTWEATDVGVEHGGTGVGTLTDGGILLGSGTGAVTALGVATNGQIPIGDGTTDPQLATITAGNGIDITNGAASITVTAETANATNPGVVELATTAETTTGTDATRAVTPDGLEDGFNGSTNITTLGTVATGTWSATDVAVAAGGTGASTAAAARANLESPPPMDSFTITGTALTTQTYPLVKTQVAITITDIHCITDTGTVIMELEEGTATAYDGGTVVDSTITCDSNGAEDDGTLTNGTIDANDWISARIGTEASSPTILGVTFYYTVD